MTKENDKKELDKEVKEGMFFAAIAYIFILCIVPLMLKKDNKFAVHHGKQGLVLLIGEIAIGILGLIPFLGLIIFIIGTMLFGILSLIGIVQVLMGKYWKMPIVANIANKIAIP